MITQQNKKEIIKIDLYIEDCHINSIEYDKFISATNGYNLYFDVCEEISYFDLSSSLAELKGFLELNPKLNVNRI